MDRVRRGIASSGHDAIPCGYPRQVAADDPSPARRADAMRNRATILAVARAAFAEPGSGPSMAEISRRSGVGMATLYRNFPGRRELLEALYTDEVGAICAAAGGDAPSPRDALATWLRRFAAFSTGKRHIAAELLTHVDSDNPVFNENRDRVLAAGRPLLAAAQRIGDVRTDLTLEQVLDMIIAITSIHEDQDYVGPILQTALDGLTV
jgi:AcrR family transcriptional regulator